MVVLEAGLAGSGRMLVFSVSLGGRVRGHGHGRTGVFLEGRAGTLELGFWFQGGFAIEGWFVWWRKGGLRDAIGRQAA